MGTELDWLEREERYRRRVTRLVTLSVVVVGVLVGVTGYLHNKQVKQARAAAQKAQVEAQAAAAKRLRDAHAAESTAVATRLSRFISRYSATPVQGAPILQVPLPSGVGVNEFVGRVWSDYAQMIDPRVTAEQRAQWFKQYYLDVMNDATLRPTAILVPAVQQDSVTLEIQRPSFTDIAQAQVSVGMREAPAPAPEAQAAGTTPPASDTTAPPASDAPAPATAPADTTPAAPPAAEPVTPPPQPPASPPADSTKPDSVPHP